MKPLVTLFLTLGFAHNVWAENLYETPHALMVDAIRNGQAEGEVGGQLAQKFTQTFKSVGKLTATATVLQRFEEGCARLQIIYRKHDVPTAKGLTEAILKTRINYCVDGKPPGGQGQPLQGLAS
jgi:hypothetical protein